MPRHEAWLLSSIDLPGAIKSEVRGSSSLLPRQLADRVLELHEVDDETLEAVEAQVRLAPLPQASPIIFAAKWRHGRRPLSCQALKDRVLYRGVGMYLSDAIPAADRSS